MQMAVIASICQTMVILMETCIIAYFFLNEDVSESDDDRFEFLNEGLFPLDDDRL